MSDVFTPEQRSAVMRRVKAQGSAAELALRRLLRALGWGRRYRLNRRDLPGTPDLVVPSARLAVFVHGCFWHGHDCRRGARPPKQNADYWAVKIARNRARDAQVRAKLVAQGWRPLVVWECELKDTAATTARLEAALGRSRRA